MELTSLCSNVFKGTLQLRGLDGFVIGMPWRSGRDALCFPNSGTGTQRPFEELTSPLSNALK